ncbi:matrixin family metalloprotease [Stappia indica]|uniref:matrixin family metalloprotease n=1 Tax=Stappia indica TaxID=538381 RepID=UPI000AD19EA1|nr:matrixin family metalloprotease [Stappia indica]
MTVPDIRHWMTPGATPASESEDPLHDLRWNSDLRAKLALTYATISSSVFALALAAVLALPVPAADAAGPQAPALGARKLQPAPRIKARLPLARLFTPLRLEGSILKWGEPRVGTPARVTYAFAEGPVSRPDARNCREMQGLDRLVKASGETAQAIRAEAAAAFRMWSEVSGLVFEEIADTDAANILLGAQAMPRGYAFTNVDFARQDAPGLMEAGGSDGRGLNLPITAKGEGARTAPVAARIAPITRSAICLNPGHDWKIGFDGNLAAYDLRYTFAHEIGHAIGLDHHLKGMSIMHFKYSEIFQGLQPADISGVQWLYGLPQR